MATVVPQGPSPADLPAGDARREAQAAVKDQLAETAETQGFERGVIDPRKFKIENEIAMHFNDLEVSEAQPEYEYCWVQAGFSGRFIKEKLSVRVRLGGTMEPVWEVVNGDMPEARELKGQMADTTRRLGDVILMRARKDRFLRVKQLREAHKAAMFTGTTTELEEMARILSTRGVSAVVRTDMAGDQLQAMAQRAAIRQQAAQMVSGMLRAGTVPGLGQPGSR